MKMMAHIAHLARRALGSWSNRPPSQEALTIVLTVLTDGEFALWNQMEGRDRRHSLEVLARFDASLPDAPRPWRAAALLHDVGKTVSGLGWASRIVATVVGPRGARFSAYHDHERLGADMLRTVSEPETVSLVSGVGDSRAVAALRDADDI